MQIGGATSSRCRLFSLGLWAELRTLPRGEGPSIPTLPLHAILADTGSHNAIVMGLHLAFDFASSTCPRLRASCVDHYFLLFFP
jgi:hypothetical protein